MKDSFIYGGTAAIMAGTIACIACASHVIHSKPKTPETFEIAEEPVAISAEPVVKLEPPPAEPATEAAPRSKDFDGSAYSDTGLGEFYISSASGSTEDGEEVFIYYDENAIMNSIGFRVWDFDGKMLTYIYVDGIQMDRGQMSSYDSSIDLTGDLLSKGFHKVEAVQFEDNDPQKAVITYKSAEYEVRDV